AGCTAAGALRRRTAGTSASRHRTPGPWRGGRRMRWVIGIDIGGTNLVVGAVTEDGARVHGLISEPTGVPEGPDAVIQRIIEMARGVIAGTRKEDRAAEILGVGIGSPGPLD